MARAIHPAAADPDDRFGHAIGGDHAVAHRQVLHRDVAGCGAGIGTVFGSDAGAACVADDPGRHRQANIAQHRQVGGRDRDRGPGPQPDPVHQQRPQRIAGAVGIMEQRLPIVQRGQGDGRIDASAEEQSIGGLRQRTGKDRLFDRAGVDDRLRMEVEQRDIIADDTGIGIGEAGEPQPMRHLVPEHGAQVELEEGDRAFLLGRRIDEQVGQVRPAGEQRHVDVGGGALDIAAGGQRVDAGRGPDLLCPDRLAARDTAGEPGRGEDRAVRCIGDCQADPQRRVAGDILAPVVRRGLQQAHDVALQRRVDVCLVIDGDDRVQAVARGAARQRRDHGIAPQHHRRQRGAGVVAAKGDRVDRGAAGDHGQGIAVDDRGGRGRNAGQDQGIRREQQIAGAKSDQRAGETDGVVQPQGRIGAAKNDCLGAGGAERERGTVFDHQRAGAGHHADIQQAFGVKQGPVRRQPGRRGAFQDHPPIGLDGQAAQAGDGAVDRQHAAGGRDNAGIRDAAHNLAEALQRAGHRQAAGRKCSALDPQPAGIQKRVGGGEAAPAQHVQRAGGGDGLQLKGDRFKRAGVEALDIRRPPIQHEGRRVGDDPAAGADGDAHDVEGGAAALGDVGAAGQRAARQVGEAGALDPEKRPARPVGDHRARVGEGGQDEQIAGVVDDRALIHQRGGAGECPLSLQQPGQRAQIVQRAAGQRDRALLRRQGAAVQAQHAGDVEAGGGLVERDARHRKCLARGNGDRIGAADGDRVDQDIDAGAVRRASGRPIGRDRPIRADAGRPGGS